MSLDLFFLPPGLALSKAQAADFVASKAHQRARQKIVLQLLKTYPGTQLVGDANAGALRGFPRGELHFERGYISWTLHGVTDKAPVQLVVDWFRTHGFVCVDPQDAGFAQVAADVDASTALDDYDQLEGARLISLRLEREYGSGLALEWSLADGRRAQLRFATFVACRVPELAELLEQVVAAVVVDPTRIGRFGHDFRILFGNDQEMTIDGAIYRSSQITRR